MVTMKNLRINRMVSIFLKIITVVIISIVIYITIPLNVPKKVVKLPSGSITNTINSLKEQGFNLTFIDKYLLVLMGQPKTGEIVIDKPRINRIDFLKKIIDAKGDFYKITLIPGETKEIFFEKLAKNYNLDYNKLLLEYEKFSSYKEAGILPETYHIPVGINEEKLIKFLTKETEKKYKEIALKELKKYDKREWLIYLTIASIIQKEAANVEEMPKISSVIYNRLRKGMPLQMDGTLNYGVYSHTKVTSKRIKEDKSAFNTYKNRGLPPYPVSSVSIEAIKSAIYPAKTDFLFFVKNRNGTHDFSKTYKEHLKNIQRAKK